LLLVGASVLLRHQGGDDEYEFNPDDFPDVNEKQSSSSEKQLQEKTAEESSSPTVIKSEKESEDTKKEENHSSKKDEQAPSSSSPEKETSEGKENQLSEKVETSGESSIKEMNDQVEEPQIEKQTEQDQEQQVEDKDQQILNDLQATINKAPLPSEPRFNDVVVEEGEENLKEEVKEELQKKGMLPSSQQETNDENANPNFRNLSSSSSSLKGKNRLSQEILDETTFNINNATLTLP
jgi:epidermal growth factor receptor substrate 15